MFKHLIWKILICCVAIVTLWFTVSSFYKVYLFLRLDAHTQAKSVQWTTKELNEVMDDRYLIKGNYSFDVEGKTYSGETVLYGPIFRNMQSAERGINDYASKAWDIYYNSNNPEYSSLQKNFPTKECLSTLLLWGLLIYFIGFTRYVQKLENKSGKG